MLQDYAKDLKGMLPSTGYTLARVAEILRGKRSFHDTADVYGPSKQGRIVAFLKLYPNRFSLQGAGPNIKVLPAAAPQPRARPVQVGGAVAVFKGVGLQERDNLVLWKSIQELRIGDSRMKLECNMGKIQPEQAHRGTDATRNTARQQRSGLRGDWGLLLRIPVSISRVVL